ncbi:hypothetical protein [Algibacter sp. L1A34]|uniref:hypothetical protein n=1 Tax=Algibacter sp. L1A34 TaxID=2686365 RepID=UPI00131B3E4B|nr:hypothetical protein [Algibacter sp. L1A34]
MRTIKLIASAVLIILFFSCDALDELTKFEINYTEEIVIESATVIDLPFNAGTPEVTSNSESTFESNNTNKDLIESIELTAMELDITAPETGDFDFLNSIKIYISAENEEEVIIAWLDQVPENSENVLDLETTSDDLKNYIKSDTYTLRVETVTDELITEDHNIDVNSTFFVDAKILGL